MVALACCDGDVAERLKDAVIGLEGKLPDTPLVAPNHPQQGERLWRQRGIACLGLQLPHLRRQ